MSIVCGFVGNLASLTEAHCILYFVAKELAT